MSRYPGYPTDIPIPKVKDWGIIDSEYQPLDFTHPVVLKQPVWADPKMEDMDLNEYLLRETHSIDHLVHPLTDLPFKDEKGFRLNPLGRTGLIGRGLLGRFGPNQAADFIGFRRDPKTFKIQILLIKRGDGTDTNALPGGMVNQGEIAEHAFVRESLEEAVFFENEEDKTQFQTLMKTQAKRIFACQVNDPRQTDYSWMESTIYSCFFQGDLQKLVNEKAKIIGRDDAKKAFWADLTYDLIKPSDLFFASHLDFIWITLFSIFMLDHDEILVLMFKYGLPQEMLDQLTGENETLPEAITVFRESHGDEHVVSRLLQHLNQVTTYFDERFKKYYNVCPDLKNSIWYLVKVLIKQSMWLI